MQVERYRLLNSHNKNIYNVIYNETNGLKITSSCSNMILVPGAPSASTGSATSQPTSTKKEKHQRTKQADKDKDKDKEKDKDKDKDKDKEKDKEEKQASGSGKRKKEKISVEKIDTGDFVVGIGDKLKVNYHEKKSPSSHGSTYEAKVIEISVQRGVPMYLVHYTGWNNRYDEWVPRERIAENLTKGSKQKTRTVSTSSANSGSGGGGGSGGGSGGGGGGGSSGNGGGGSGTGSHSGQQPPGPGDKHLGGKDGSSKIPPSPGVSASGGGASGTGAPNMGGVISMPNSISGGALKTPHSTSSGTSSTASGAKRGRGRSDSMPPRSTTPSSVVSGASRTKSPAASQQHLQQQKKRPTRVPPGAANPRRPSDASMATESDSDSDEPVRRPKRQSAKEKPTAGSKAQAAQSSGKAGRMTTVTAPPPNASDDSDADEEEDTAGASGPTPEPAKQPRGSRAGGNRAMSSGAASTKGRDYDLSEIRSELKGFQPQLLTGEERKDVVVKSEPSTDPGQATVKKEPKVESSAKSSSTELSSETESYLDDDSQSSDYRKQPKTGAKKEPPRKLSHHSEQQVSKREDQPHPGIKAEPKVEPKQEAEETTKPGKPFLSGPDIKPTTSSLIAPARFGTNLGAGGSGTSGSNSGAGPSVSAKYTSVIVEKPLTVGGKKSGEQHSAKKAELLKKPAGAGASAAALEAKKFAEPVASLKVELPAACSPSSSSSSSSSFCSSASGGSSSSATRSLPDMSKLEISSGTAAASAGAPPGAPSQPPNPPASSSKETKYSSSAATTSAGSSGLGMSKSLSSDVYEFKDTEPFEFEKRISPMAGATGGAGSVLMPTGPVVAPSVFTTIMTTAPVVVGGGPARKQALKSIQQSQEPHQLPPAAGYSGLSGGQAPSKAKKRGSPLKEPPPGLEKPKIYKLDKEQVQQPQPQQQQQSPPNLKVNQPAGQVGTQIKIHTTPPGIGGGGGGIPSASSPAQLAPPHHATPFDALRKSPSFNLNILALNEELAQTVQETTRALTDALQPPGPPPPATPQASGSSNVPPMSPVAPPVIPTPLATSSGPTCPSTPPAGGATVAPKLSTPPNPVKPAPAPHIVGSPFVETRNVFELSTSNEGSGYSSGEGSKDNKLEQLENVKILLAGATAVFGLDAGKQKTTSIADKVLKAISQKKEEVEQNKSKPPVAVPVPVVELPAKITAAAGGTAAGGTGTVGAAGLPAGGSDGQSAPPTAAVVVPWETMMLPLKIQTAGPLLGEIYRPGPATSSPETKSILESSLPAKNSELSETIQKLECAIQQRKTPVGGALSLASSTAGTPPAAHTPNSTVTAGAGGFSDESMDSTDSEQRLVIEDVIAEEQTTTTTTGEQKSPGSGQEDGLNVSTLTAETEATSSSDPAPVKLDVGGKAQPGIQAPIPVKLTESSFAGKLTAVTQQPPPLAKLQAAEAEGKAKGSLSSFGIPIVLPEIPASVVVLTPALMVASAAAAETSEAVMPAEMATVMRHSPGSPAQALASPKGFQPSPKLAESAAGGLLLKTYSTPMGTSLVAGVSGVPTGAPAAAANFQQDAPAPAEIPTSYIADQDAGETSSTSSPVVARPFVMHAVGKEIFGNVVAPAASSPLIGDPHNESINLLCEETIPGSPAPLYGGKDDQLTNPALAGLSGIGPLPPDTPPPGAVPALQQQIQIQTTHPQQPGAANDSGRAAESEVIPSAVTSSPDSASQDESGEETKKHTEMEHDLEAGGLGVLNKRKRTRKQVPLSQAVAAQLQSLSKRRRQVSGMRNLKTTTAAAGSDTDDNSDNLAPSSGQTQQRQSARQQLMPQANPLQQQQQQAQAQHLAQQQAALQASLATSQSGVRPCPYNFLVELDPALSSDECITILRKQIQDLRKAYNTIKAELTVIDRRRKKLRRREREKKQHQLQSQQQGKICA
ncbi:mucin-19 isoform X2 [Drosophila bipectinata]|uniref:mucin-19 isoform X2 n=1 Tax=Drosophila bipectinata TaxID=42026 RepID=UPI0038B3FBBF